MSDHAKLVSWARGAAVCWVALICAFLLQPPELSPDISSPLKQSAEQIARFWGARPDESLVHRALHLAALAAGLAVLGVVGALSTAERRIPRWASYGGALGASVIALSNARYLAMEPTYARLFLESDAAIQPAVAVASASLALDPFGLLEWGGIAVWIFAVTTSLGGWSNRALAAAGGVAVLGLFGTVVGEAAWAPALEVAPQVGTPGLVAWLLLLPRAVARGASAG